MTFPIKVLGARIVVKVDPTDNKTVGGIILPGAEDEPVNTGVAMTTGEGARLDDGTHFPMEVAVGDKLLFTPLAGAPVTLPDDDQKYLVINEGDVLAIME